MEKVEVRHTKDGKGSGLFAIEDVEKDDYVIEYVGKIEYKKRGNIYLMKINGINLWINGDKIGGPTQYINTRAIHTVSKYNGEWTVCHVCASLTRRI